MTLAANESQRDTEPQTSVGSDSWRSYAVAETGCDPFRTVTFDFLSRDAAYKAKQRGVLAWRSPQIGAEEPNGVTPTMFNTVPAR